LERSDDYDDDVGTQEIRTTSLTTVGYKRPPVHSRFQKGTSGNPSGRAKGSKNLKTLFRQILKEKITLREGANVRKVSKGEAILRGLIVAAIKGDAKSAGTVFRLAEQSGEFEEQRAEITQIERVIRWMTPEEIEKDTA